MTLGGGENTDGTGMRDIVHAPNTNTPEAGSREERRVRFFSLRRQHWPSTIPGTDFANFTPETPYQKRHANDLWNLARQSATMAKDKGKNPAPQTTTPPQQHTTPSCSTTANTPAPTGIPQDLLDAPITHAAMLTIMAVMENRFELRLRLMPNRLLAGRNNTGNNNPRPQQQQQ